VDAFDELNLLPRQSTVKLDTLKNGIRYAYVGNVHHKEADSTYCHAYGGLLIGRDWYQLCELEE